MLKVSGLHAFYGSIHALKGIDLEVHQNEIVSLIGSNGAGKSTALSVIAGLVRSSSGSVEFEGRNITNRPAFQMVKLGISLSPEGREVFPALTVEQNLRLGAYIKKDKAIEDSFTRVYDLFPRLKERIKQQAGTLSGGEQQMLAIGRALMCEPRLLMLDEPSMGLAPILVDQIFDIIKELHAAGTTILLVEQNANKALGVADRAYVLESGRVKLSGTGKELAESDEIRKAYLGG